MQNMTTHPNFVHRLTIHVLQQFQIDLLLPSQSFSPLFKYDHLNMFSALLDEGWSLR